MQVVLNNLTGRLQCFWTKDAKVKMLRVEAGRNEVDKKLFDDVSKNQPTFKQFVDDGDFVVVPPKELKQEQAIVKSQEQTDLIDGVKSQLVKIGVDKRKLNGKSLEQLNNMLKVEKAKQAQG